MAPFLSRITGAHKKEKSQTASSSTSSTAATSNSSPSSSNHGHANYTYYDPATGQLVNSVSSSASRSTSTSEGAPSPPAQGGVEELGRTTGEVGDSNGGGSVGGGGSGNSGSLGKKGGAAHISSAQQGGDLADPSSHPSLRARSVSTYNQVHPSRSNTLTPSSGNNNGIAGGNGDYLTGGVGRHRALSASQADLEHHHHQQQQQQWQSLNMSSSSGGTHFRGAENVSDETYDDNQLLPPLFGDSHMANLTRSADRDNSSPASPPSPASFSIRGGDPSLDGGYTGILNSGETGTAGNHKIEVGEGSLTLDSFGDIGTDRVTGSAQGIAPELVVSTATPEATTPIRSRPPSFRNESTTSTNNSGPPSRPDQSLPGGDHPPTPGRSSNPTRQGTRPAFDPSSGISAIAALNTIAGLGAPGTTVQLGGISSPQQQGGSSRPGSRRGSVSSQHIPSIQHSAPTSSGGTPGCNTPATGLMIPGGATSPAVATQVNSNGQILNVSSSNHNTSTNSNQTGTTTSSSNGPLSPPSAVYSRRPSFSRPITNEHAGPSQSALTAASAARNHKGRSSSIAGGIGGALALSGVALASPAPQLSQPLGFIGRQPSMGNLNGGTPGSGGGGGKDSRPGTAGGPANGELTFGGNVTTSPGRNGHLQRSSSFSQDTATSDDSGAGGFDNPMLHYDALGGFDEVVSNLGTGYAVASKKRNDDFHMLFKNVPEDDYLIEDYGCALQREILIQGRLYISEHHLCFYANIFGWITTLIIPFSEVVTIEKRMTALIIPNAVMVATLHARHVFASFISRDSAYDLIVNIFRITHPTVPASAALPDAVSVASEDETGLSDEDRAGSKGKGSKKSMNRGKSKGTDDKPDMGVGAGVGIVGTDKPGGQLVNGGATLDKAKDVGKAGGGGAAKPTKAAKAPPHPPTVCSCSKDGLHLANVCMDTVFPSTPEKIYNLMFTSGFLKTFWAENQRLTGIQIGDWAPAKSGTPLLTRDYSYVKPLSAPVGPKSTKCRLSDENVHVDFDDYVVNLTTTRTPDVPGGGVFSVKTRSCFTWAKGGQCRVLVTTGVEWTGRSMLKGIINSSAIDGQKTYHADLEKAMRAYINQHRSEFQDEPGEAEEEGEEAGEEPDSVPDQPSSTTKDHSQSVDERQSKKETSADRSPQPAESEKGAWQKQLDPVMPYLQPVIDLGTDALGMLIDVIGGMSTTGLILTVVISVLLISNLWTLTSLRQGVGSGPPPLPLPPAPASYSRSTPSPHQRSPDDVAQAVRGALHDFFEAHSGGAAANERASVLSEKFDKKLESAAEAGNVKAEVEQLLGMLDTIEERVGTLRQKLTSLN